MVDEELSCKKLDISAEETSEQVEHLERDLSPQEKEKRKLWKK